MFFPLRNYNFFELIVLPKNNLAIETVPDLQRVKITDNVLQAQLGSTRPISYRSYFDLLKDAAFHLDQATKRGNKT